jgi:hypothetical protein
MTEQTFTAKEKMSLSKLLTYALSNLDVELIADFKSSGYDIITDNNLIEKLIVKIDSLPEILPLSTFIINYTLKDENSGEFDELTASLQAENFDHAVEQLLNEHSCIGQNVIVIDYGDNPGAALYVTNDDVNDYQAILKPCVGAAATISVGNIRLQIKQESEGVVVDSWDENYNECLATLCTVFVE